MTTSNCLLECRSIHKAFSGVPVLRGMDLSLNSGEVLSIIGGNGAGKSTLMKIIMGLYEKDQGELYINGEQINKMTPAMAQKKGVYLVPQEPLLFPNMTIRENIFLGFDNSKEKQDYLKHLLDVLEWNIDLNRVAQTLSIAEQQLVEILRGLVRESKVLILDEPTSSLTYNEINSLFQLIERLTDEGTGIIYITHRLNEVFQISDQILIMKDGKTALSGSVDEFTKEDLIRGLVPDNTMITQYQKTQYSKEQAEVVLSLSNYSGHGFKDVNLEVHAGEVLGLAGVVGAGRTELAETIFGRDKPSQGTVSIKSIDITGKQTAEVISLGLNYVPEDRFKYGLFGISSIGDNMTASSLFSMPGVMVNHKIQNNVYEYFKDKFKIKCNEIDQEAGSLSGGNQQKIVISKAVASMPKVLILDEPTRGIDASAREDVYKIINELKETGVAILLISSDIEEIVQVSDRVLTMYRGRINAEFIDQINIDTITSAIFGVTKEEVVQ